MALYKIGEEVGIGCIRISEDNAMVFQCYINHIFTGQFFYINLPN